MFFLENMKWSLGKKSIWAWKGQDSGGEGMFIKEQVALYFQRSVLLQSLKVLSKEQVATILPSLDKSQPETLLSWPLQRKKYLLIVEDIKKPTSRWQEEARSWPPISWRWCRSCWWSRTRRSSRTSRWRRGWCARGSCTQCCASSGPRSSRCCPGLRWRCGNHLDSSPLLIYCLCWSCQ